MWLIAGLGNPGKHYLHSRHNAGFLLVDYAASRWAPRSCMSRSGLSLSVKLRYAEERVVLLKPQTFMNRSGLAVREAMTRYAEDEPRLIVAYDDFHLPLGKLRLRERGSAGGHHGMESIIDCLGTGEFFRLRLGIADEEVPPDAVDFVLGPFPPDARNVVEEMLDNGLQALESLMTAGPAKTMSLFN